VASVHGLEHVQRSAPPQEGHRSGGTVPLGGRRRLKDINIARLLANNRAGLASKGLIVLRTGTR
jgi:hypothetical protein